MGADNVSWNVVVDVKNNRKKIINQSKFPITFSWDIGVSKYFVEKGAGNLMPSIIKYLLEH